MNFAPCDSETDRQSHGRVLTPSHFELEKNEVRSLDLGHDTVMLRVRSGLCWITLEGDQTDYAAVEGDAHSFAGPGLLVIQALSPDSSVEIIPLQ
jgi:hypothetical protein